VSNLIINEKGDVMKKTNFVVIVFAVIAVVAGMLLCMGCNDGGVESGDVAEYLEQFHVRNDSTVVYRDSGEFTDNRDGTKYKWVTIGDITWMAENLNYETGNSRCYDDDPENCAKYGRLYDRETAKTVCPTGWVSPSQYAVLILSDYLGGLSVAGGGLKAKSGWRRSYSSNIDGSGSDEFGFNALPGGQVRIWGDEFSGINYSGYWWVLGDKNIPDQSMSLLGENKKLILYAEKIAYDDDGNGFNLEMNSVRCLRAAD
jgi:uncharacterized protein (TIGR02145 family)